jgi:hypothetical protein
VIRKLVLGLAGLALVTVVVAGAILFRYFIPHSLPPDAVRSLHGQLGIEHDYLTGNIYNGSRWKLSTVVVRVSVYPSPPDEQNLDFTLTSTPCSASEWSLPPNTKASQVRDYLLRVRLDPLSVGEFKEAAGLVLAKSDYWGCQIVAATGVR